MVGVQEKFPFVLQSFFYSRVVSSEVERFLDTEEVRSSILLSPTIDSKGSGDFLLNPFYFGYSIFTQNVLTLRHKKTGPRLSSSSHRKPDPSGQDRPQQRRTPCLPNLGPPCGALLGDLALQGIQPAGILLGRGDELLAEVLHGGPPSIAFLPPGLECGGRVPRGLQIAPDARLRSRPAPRHRLPFAIRQARR